jgi:hypothetical protein
LRSGQASATWLLKQCPESSNSTFSPESSCA